MTIYAYHASVTIKVSNLQNFHFLSLLVYFNLISLLRALLSEYFYLMFLLFIIPIYANQEVGLKSLGNYCFTVKISQKKF